jgi:hypothetical protein
VRGGECDVWELTAGGLRHGGSCVREVLLRGCRVRGSRVSRVANVTQNAGALLASVRPLV